MSGTNRQKNNALAAKGRARKEVRAERQAHKLQAERAWNWQWPENGNCWQTHSTPMQGAPKTYFTSTGPSARTVARRAARRARGRH